jgi:hypothetical protein
MIPGWAAALAVALLIEVPLVALLFPGQRLKMAAVAIIMNAATNLTLNLVLPRFYWLHGRWLLPGEVLAVVAEATAYALASRPRDVPRSLFASALSNTLSFAAGVFVPFIRSALRAGH